MKKNLKQLRHEKRLSQQELANLSGISLRTIQRIEKNESKGSPYVIKTLCLALDIDPQTICFELEDMDEKKTDRHQELSDIESIDSIQRGCESNPEIKYINFSSLIVLLIPFANMLSVPVFYFLFKKRLAHTIYKELALKILSFQIIWSIATIILMIATPLSIVCFPSIPTSILDIPLFVWVYWFMLSFHLITTLVISFDLNRMERSIQFIPNIL